MAAFCVSLRKIYLVLVCALLELFELIVKHSELPGDALYPSMQTPIFTVLGVEIVFIALTLFLRANYCVLPRKEIRGNIIVEI